MKRSPKPSKRTWVRSALLVVGALLFLFEEWLWLRALQFFAWLDRQPAMRWIERRLSALPAAIALVVLCVPVVLLFPFKIFGLWLIGTGRLLTGCCVMLAAKIVSTAIVARIFLACRPQLMEMPWFARLHAWLIAARDRVHAWMSAHPAWQATRRALRHLRSIVRSWSGGRRSGLARWRLRRKAQRRREFAARP